MTVQKIDFNALKRPHWNQTQEQNANLVIDFVQGIMNDHDFEYITETFGKHNYVQHNRNMPDGIDGLVGYLKKFVKNFPEFNYDVKKIIVDGDMVSLHSHATLKHKHRGNQEKGFNIIDTWRVDNGKLVEHWDAVQAIDLPMRLYATFVGGRKMNKNGFF
ncbi:nuclear transport factor 2 family protein [Pseudobacteriovorax antillogorgiicola]|uniref:Predicted SnoaL-like aldol condensation-catalyzing enzyme n=1 Tax=Pseudobacteriovorax antillogorgiicola TaxID=1513793 RepID=A0A1Y6C1Q4_9BACT|nr:ester cyclase [Pseudobacteriovorax antillogorgiicola]TCS52389.1 putative SnoaL-like aldol condensation-catalyzing enzyme [Pseudobacteriovorax antillogorgiicola]SMF29147.1 Predicted SnoaL-like aldol condensation-catalyzing enzyme [Pseudobacteriovorax antillogorgiicola]